MLTTQVIKKYKLNIPLEVFAKLVILFKQDISLELIKMLYKAMKRNLKPKGM